MVLCSKTLARRKADGEHGKQYHFYCTYVHTSLVYCSSCTISRQKVATVCVWSAETSPEILVPEHCAVYSL